MTNPTPTDACYDAAIEAVNRVAQGVPAWVITVAVNAAFAACEELA
jgi:hypothetical protein